MVKSIAINVTQLAPPPPAPFAVGASTATAGAWTQPGGVYTLTQAADGNQVTGVLQFTSGEESFSIVVGLDGANLLAWSDINTGFAGAAAPANTILLYGAQADKGIVKAQHRILRIVTSIGNGRVIEVRFTGIAGNAYTATLTIGSLA